MSNSKRVSLLGSEHMAQPGTRSIGPTDPHQLIEVSVYLKHRRPMAMEDRAMGAMSSSDFTQQYGADPAHIEKIRQFAREYNLQMLERGDEAQRRTVTLAGTAAAMEKAFSVELNEYQNDNGTYHGHAGTIQIPEAYASIIQGVLGLDNRQQARPHIRYRNRQRGAAGVRASNLSRTAVQVAQLYNFPADANGTGQTIGMIELGGGFRPADIQEYFQHLQLTAPTVKAVSVNHAQNAPSTPQSADGEVALDIQVAGAVAPGVTLIVYFAPNTARGFVDALSTAVHDQLNRPTVVSISWGSAESTWTAQAIEAFDQVAQEAGILGVTITASSGDSGSSDGVNDGRNHVDFPASSPHIMACGGTRLAAAANHTIASETVWNDGPQGGATGGGYSTVFARPAWQSAVVSQTGRGVPDVAGNADPDTGYEVLIDGEWEVVGGTSAVAPLWAGLTILMNQKLNTRLGFVNPLMYAIDQSSGFRDITQGNNGAYTATPGWDACTGLGSPIGNKLMQALSAEVTPVAAKEKEKTATHRREHTTA